MDGNLTKSGRANEMSLEQQQQQQQNEEEEENHNAWQKQAQSGQPQAQQFLRGSKQPEPQQQQQSDVDDGGHRGMTGWQVAYRGIELALNNEVEEAQKLLKGDSTCIHRQAGFCYLTFINALMTFEEEKMSLSLSTLRAMEKRCSSELAASSTFSSSLLSMKSRLWGGSTTSFLSAARDKPDVTTDAEAIAAAMRLEQQIIVADCQVLAAILNFLQQDWGSYMKGAWVLRKAWKIYQKTYAQIRHLYIKRVGLGGNSLAPPPPSNQAVSTTDLTSKTSTKSNGAQKMSDDDSGGSNTSSTSGSPIKEIPSIGSTNFHRSKVSHSFSVPLNLFSIARSDQQQPNLVPVFDHAAMSAASLISPATIKRLMSAVSFGYGIFHLAVSLLPPKLLNVIHFLGFEGDRQTGIQALHFARQGSDMRGPLATLALLWFHTIVRPFFGLDGSNLRSGADAAQRLIDSSKPAFEDSALFLFFQGRVDRLKLNFTGALLSYERALHVSAQREVRLLCLHEVGWSYVLLLHWEKSSQAFLQLKKESRWSKSFYCYLSAVCLGSSGDISSSLALAEETPRLVRRTNNPLERFLLRRANKMVKDSPDQDYCLLLAYELLYLWNALGACLKHSHASIQIDCERMYVPALEGVRQLILGSVFSNTGHEVRAKECYLQAIRHGECGSDLHTAAFAAYELGMLLCKNHETRAEGRHYLEMARDNYHNYDFENRLTVRIYSALRYYSTNSKTSTTNTPTRTPNNGVTITSTATTV